MSSSTSLSIASWITCILGTCLCLFVTSIMAISVPKYEMIYKDLGIALPGITETMIQLSRMGIWYILLSCSIANVIKEFKYNGDPAIAAFNAVFLFISFMAMTAVTVGMYLPLIRIIETISGSP